MGARQLWHRTPKYQRESALGDGENLIGFRQSRYPDRALAVVVSGSSTIRGYEFAGESWPGAEDENARADRFVKTFVLLDLYKESNRTRR
jgi:hypothetical protein